MDINNSIILAWMHGTTHPTNQQTMPITFTTEPIGTGTLNFSTGLAASGCINIVGFTKSTVRINYYADTSYTIPYYLICVGY